ncbi:hypothetical protein U1Q18_049706, partial [Sarracenia purpurea var. burkii]
VNTPFVCIRPMEAGKVHESGVKHHGLSNNLETMSGEAMKEHEEEPKSKDAALLSRIAESDIGTNPKISNYSINKERVGAESKKGAEAGDEAHTHTHLNIGEN